MTTTTQHKGTILVVDDDRLVLATLTHGLSQAGYHVVDADNGDDAILMAREHQPLLALLDIRMEGMSGFDVAAYLRASTRIPFMFLSAFADADTARQVAELGAVDYLVKPLDIGQIVPAVDAALARVRQGAAGGAAVASAPAVPTAPTVPTVPAMPSAASPAPTPSAAVHASAQAAPAPMPTAVAMAIGILMHRYSLARGPAQARLEKLAETEGRPVAEQAERLLQAVELLSA